MLLSQLKNILNKIAISLTYQEQVNGIICAAHIYLPYFSSAYLSPVVIKTMKGRWLTQWNSYLNSDLKFQPPFLCLQNEEVI